MLGKLQVNYRGIETDRSTGEQTICFRVSVRQTYLCKILDDEMKKCIKDKKFDFMLMVDKYHQSRSLDQNNFLWGLLAEISAVTGKKQWDLYIEALADYGVSTALICLEEAIPILEQNFRVVRRVGEKMEQGKKMIKCICYQGSSNYNTKEMKILIDGVLLDCKDLDIDTDIVQRKMMDS